MALQQQDYGRYGRDIRSFPCCLATAQGQSYMGTMIWCMVGKAGLDAHIGCTASKTAAIEVCCISQLPHTCLRVADCMRSQRPKDIAAYPAKHCGTDGNQNTKPLLDTHEELLGSTRVLTSSTPRRVPWQTAISVGAWSAGHGDAAVAAHDQESVLCADISTSGGSLKEKLTSRWQCSMQLLATEPSSTIEAI